MSFPSAAAVAVVHRCWAEISLAALRHNAGVARTQSGLDLMAVVKANAYGHGAVTVARALQDQVAVFGVANLQEALELRSAGLDTPILLLGTCLAEEQEPALRAGFHVCVNSLAEARAWSELAGRLGTTTRGHVVLDTGMGRMGFIEPEWTEDTVRALVALPHISWEGLATHLPSPDEDAGFTRRQIELFHQSVQLAQVSGLQPRWVDLASSAGLLGYPSGHEFCNLVRPGLMLYGVDPLANTGLGDPYQEKLRLVLTWKTRVILVRELPEGHGISYGRSHVTGRPTRVATLACGYADGYPRQVSGKNASVLLHGQRCPLLGRVTMDQIMVDVTDLPADQPVVPGDEVVLLGTQGGAKISAEEVADKAGTISWHVFTGITARVARVVVA